MAVEDPPLTPNGAEAGFLTELSRGGESGNEEEREVKRGINCLSSYTRKEGRKWIRAGSNKSRAHTNTMVAGKKSGQKRYNGLVRPSLPMNF